MPSDGRFDALPIRQPVWPVARCGTPTGSDSGDPRCRRYTVKITTEPTASISDCQFWNLRLQEPASPR